MSRETNANNSSHGPPPYHLPVNGPPPSAAMYYSYPPYGHAPPPPLPPGDDGNDRMQPPSYPSASPPRHSYPSQMNPSASPPRHPYPSHMSHPPPQSTSDLNLSNGGNEASPKRQNESLASSYPPQPSENYPPPPEGYPPHHPNLYGEAWRGHPMYTHNPNYPPRETAYWPPFHPPPPLPYWRGETHLPPKERPPPELEGGRTGATSPSQIETSHRDEVQNMGCTCKKTRCLKLYCQCFQAQLYCGSNCRCLSCYNVVAHDKLRKEAIKSILLRNPVAFDSKFKKTPTTAGTVPIAPAPPTLSATLEAAQAARALAHKLGCKCRKSSCMKKYCECYAGNVKCSSNCRCIGCKNTGGGNGGPPFDRRMDAIALQQPGPFPIAPNPVASRRATGEPWLAAQNLTFLKRGSPPEKKKLLFESSSGDIASMPSLASSEGTSPGGEYSSERMMKRTLPPQKHADEDGGALLLAAVAMTEFGQSPMGEKTKLDGE